MTPDASPEVQSAVSAAFRAEWGRVVATLIAVTGDWDLAEECAQEAFARALQAWERDGVPARPGAWLTTAARNRAVDVLRRRSNESVKLREAALLQPPEPPGASMLAPPVPEDGGSGISDDRLRLIFTCCHPALPLEARVALTLRALAGLTTAEIARALLVTETTMAQRLVRAKRKIRNAAIPYRVPPASLLPERTAGVLAVLYLLFNEGYSASGGAQVVRGDLCAEAIRLARLLARLMPGEPEAAGLLALMLLQDSRRAARTDSEGELVTLEDQDRGRWDRAEIAEGRQVLHGALRAARPGPYQLQAVIAACHASAGKAADTDWPMIARVYGQLARIAPSPVVELNRAVAVGMAHGPEAGLALLDSLAGSGALAGYHLLPAARGDLLRRLGRQPEAAGAFNEALALAGTDAERRYLARRQAEAAAGRAARARRQRAREQAREQGGGVSIGARFPASADTIVVGGGTAGAVIAGRLAAGGSGRTLLLEAGPDYGPADSGRWPRDLLDATGTTSSHDWGYTGEFGGRVIHFGRARVIGGCSSHNSGAVVFGSRFDYDGWAAAGNAGWSARELAPLFASACRQLRVRPVGLDELTPFQRACRDAIAANGIPAVADFNNLDEEAGVAPFPVNIDGGTRVNSAFGYVDPVRDRLTVAGDALVERVLVRGGQATGVAVRDGQRLAEVRAARVVLCAGAYGSPAILLRSGIGPAAELAAIGVAPVLDLPGVGRNLHDQPCAEVSFEGSGELIRRMEHHQAETGWQPYEQVIAKFPSAACRQGFDLHIYPVGGGSRTGPPTWGWTLGVACLTPLSRGSVRLTGPGPDDKLVIDHRYLSDPGGCDRARLAEGLERVREVAQAPELRRLLGREMRPGPEVCGRQEIERFLDQAAVHYYHPAGSCKMGPGSDPGSVADSEGRVHGIDGLYVADASLMPAVTSGNTNMPVAVIGERIARSLLGPGDTAAP